LPVEELPNRQYVRTGPVQWELWEEQENEAAGGQKETVTVRVDGGELPLQFTTIPVAVFIANPDPDDERQTCGPVFYDLGEIARRDYNQQSDFFRSVHITASPVPVGVNLKPEGADETYSGARAIGPTRMMECTEGGSFDYAEPKGTGLAMFRTVLVDNKELMRRKGFETLYSDASVATTATEQLLRAGKRASRLAQMSASLHDCLETILRYVAQWRGLGEDAGGEVTMPPMDGLVLDAQQLNVMLNEVTQGVQSKETYWKAKQRAGLLPDDFDPAVEMALLDSVAEAAADRQARAFNAGDIGRSDEFDA
jgi:hypothetical protein